MRAPAPGRPCARSGTRAPWIRIGAGIVLAGALAGLVPGPGDRSRVHAETRVASWNLNNLHHRLGEALRERAPVRGRRDIEALRRYAERLDAHLVALQEVNGPKAAALVFDRERYLLPFSGRQRLRGGDDRGIYVGFAVRRGHFDATRVRDYEPLGIRAGEGYRTRWGLDIELEREGRRLRILNVHLKARCARGSLVRPRAEACALLGRQIAPLEAWIDAREREGVPYLVVGDFNRAFDRWGKRDHLWQAIDDRDPPGLVLHRIPAGREPACWGGTRRHHRYPIDFFVLNEAAWRLYVPGSFLELDYAPPDRRLRAGLPSDHCPIRITLRF